MVGIQYKSQDGTMVLQKFRVEAGILFIRDTGNLNNYYWGLFSGYQNGRSPHICKLNANALDIVTNTIGTVSVTGLAGEAAYAIIPFAIF